MSRITMQMLFGGLQVESSLSTYVNSYVVVIDAGVTICYIQRGA